MFSNIICIQLNSCFHSVLVQSKIMHFQKQINSKIHLMQKKISFKNNRDLTCWPELERLKKTNVSRIRIFLNYMLYQIVETYSRVYGSSEAIFSRIFVILLLSAMFVLICDFLVSRNWKTTEFIVEGVKSPTSVNYPQKTPMVNPQIDLLNHKLQSWSKIHPDICYVFLIFRRFYTQWRFTQPLNPCCSEKLQIKALFWIANQTNPELTTHVLLSAF